MQGRSDSPELSPSSSSDVGFQPWSWAAVISLLCLLPALLSLTGVDFSSGHAALNPESLIGRSSGEIADAAHHALHGSFTHTLLEWSGLCAAIFVCILCFVQFRMTREPSLAIIGIALICAGAMDGFHTFAADRLIEASAPNQDLIPFTWAICRLFNGTIQLIGVGIFAFRATNTTLTSRSGFLIGISATFVLLSYLIVAMCATSSSLPNTMFPDAAIKRPFDIYPLIPFLLCAFFVFPAYLRRHRTIFAYSLLLSLIPQIATQFYMAFGSDTLHDSAFNIAHGLKVLAYAVPIVGLITQSLVNHRKQQALTAQMGEQTAVLQQQTHDLENAQGLLSAAADFSNALNQTDPSEIYTEALRSICKGGSAAVSVLYSTASENRLVFKSAFGIDTSLTDTSVCSPDGLPTEVLRRREVIDSKELTHAPHTLRLGITSIEVRSIIGWPITSENETVGVLLTAHTTEVGSKQRGFISQCLEQLGIRLQSIQTEDQRKKLVTDLEKQSVELQRLSNEAQRASRVKSEFLANMSHELRTPMNSILGFTKRLLKKLQPSLSERDSDALETVHRNARHLLNLINDILDLSKIEAGRMELQYKSFDLVQTARDVLSDASPLIDGKNISLQLTSSSDVMMLDGDPIRIRQVLTNLISNAVRFTQMGHVTIALRTTCDKDGQPAVDMAVSDTGEGIREEDRCKLFNKFTQIDGSSSRKVGGTGLGLVITAEFVRMHGGRISVESVFEEGSTFTVTIPRYQTSPSSSGLIELVSPQMQPSQPQSRNFCTSTSEAASKLVLCIDDDPDVLRLLRECLEEENYAVITGTGTDAVRLAREHKPIALCLDLAMPEVTGHDIIAILQQDETLSEIPIIIISATADDPKNKNLACQCLPKPINESDLLDAISQLTPTTILSVLIAEDDPDTRKLLALEFEQRGIDVRAVADGKEAMLAMAEQTPDLLILDLAMPVMDGFKLLNTLKAEPAFAMVHTTVLSAKDLTNREKTWLRTLNTPRYMKGERDITTLVNTILASSRVGSQSEQALH